jgi:Amt family ammonium transporter
MAPTNNPASSELKAILDAAGTMIITTDLAGTVRIFNPAAERLLGWSADEVVGRHAPALWHDPAQVAARAAELSHELGRTVSPGFEVFMAIACNKLNEQRQWTFIRKNGSRFPVQLDVSAIRDAAGTITGYVGTAQDLTARVEAEQERDRLFNVSVDMLCIAGTDSYFKRVNPAFHRTLGWSEGELLARPFLEFVHPEDQAATIREVEKLAAGQVTVQFENRYLCKDGSWCWLSWNTMPQEDGLLYASARDISDLKRAEESLRQSRRNLEITLNSIGDAVIATDAARHITWMNPVAVQMTGWTVAEAVGRSIDEVFRIIHEETRDPAVIPVDDVLATGTVHGLANHTVLISRDGTERPIADSAAPIRDDAGRITGVVLVFRDVAEERQFERELQQLNVDLERRIEDRTKTLAESERRLQNGNRILETLSSDASLEQTLELIARSVETEDPSALCSILLLDESGKHLLHGAAPSLPDFYNQAIHGLEIGESVGSCGAAAATKRRVIADDIQTHPGWAQFLTLTDKAGVRSCWSEPVLADAGQVLGTFAVYHREPRTPKEKDVERIQWAASFVRLAIERKQAQAKLIQSERFNRATLDALSAHVAVLDEAGKIVATNRAWRGFAQANDTPWQTVGEGTNYLAICDRAAAAGDADAAATARAIRQVIASEQEIWLHEYPCHSTDEQRWFYCRVTRFPGEEAVHVVVAHENITAMKQVQKQLAVARAQFETLDRVSPVGIMFFDKTGNCVDVNDRWSEMSGFSRQEALGDHWLSAVHPEDRSRVSHAWSEVVRVGGKFESEFRFLLPDGKIVWLVSQGVPIRDTSGSVSGFIRVATDVTEQKRTEQALRLLSTDLRDAKAFADTVVENVSGLFYVLDQKGVFVRWNQSLQDLLGLSAEQMRQTSALSIIHESDHERIAGKIANVFTDGHAEDEACLLLKDGPRHFLLNGRRVEINNVVYLVGSGADITRRKQADQDIHRLNQSLEQRVRDRTTQLTNANAELAKVSQSKSEFLATMSHELRTPLNGILGMNELLLTTELSERQREYVAACNSSGKLLVQLVNDILDLSKIEAGKLELDPRQCSLEAFTYDVVDIMSHAARTKQLDLSCRIAPEACVVGMFDDTRLRQVLVNLVGNAVKFTSSGRITVAVDRVDQGDRTVRLRFAVSDTGMGIPQERLDRLFKSFSQVDSSTTRQFGGTGLGLSICKQLIELMGGEIGVESRVGVGTTFWFEIEIVTSDGVSTTEQGKRLLAGTRIIAIDGLDRERFQVAEYLRSWECPFQQVANVNEALAAVQSATAAGDPVRIILADCRLVTGDEFVQLQELAALPDLHVIGLGVPPDELSRNHLYGLGIQHLLNDPIRPSVLFDTLTKVLSVRQGAAPFEADRPSLPPVQEVTLSGHILVAEDNRINQLYMVELLQYFGCTSDLVVNGEEALIAVQKQRYDLVLMDCQMPEMDGFTAAHEIRKREAAGQHSERLPIVALTANALKGDRERCLEAGMDEYVSKPVESGQLKAVLAKYLSRTSSQRDTTGKES